MPGLPIPFGEVGANPKGHQAFLDREQTSAMDLSPGAGELTDGEAVEAVRAHLEGFQRRYRDSHHERILLGLIYPKAEFLLDEKALASIFSAANEIFFAGQLTQRVKWVWSDNSLAPHFDDRVMGHTWLRKSKRGGYETLITLSSAILQDQQYNRRLLISVFLHELIHCYLFICCGFNARASGGHTHGFETIADIIDKWVGRRSLYLCDMEADLTNFFVNRNAHNRSGTFTRPYDKCCPADVAAPWQQPILDRWDHLEPVPGRGYGGDSSYVN